MSRRPTGAPLASGGKSGWPRLVGNLLDHSPEADGESFESVTGPLPV